MALIMKLPRDYCGSGEGQKVMYNHDTKCTVLIVMLNSTSIDAENALSNI